MLSPAWHRLSSATVVAAWPEETASAAGAPSTAAIRASRTSHVGLLRRV